MKTLVHIFYLLVFINVIGCKVPTSPDSLYDTKTMDRVGWVDETGNVSNIDHTIYYMFDGKNAFSLGFKHTDYVHFKAEYQEINKHQDHSGRTIYSKCKLLSMKKAN